MRWLVGLLAPCVAIYLGIRDGFDDLGDKMFGNPTVP